MSQNPNPIANILMLCLACSCGFLPLAGYFILKIAVEKKKVRPINMPDQDVIYTDLPINYISRRR